MTKEHKEWEWKFIEKNYSKIVTDFEHACTNNGGIFRKGEWGTGNFSCHKGDDVIEFEPMNDIIRRRVKGSDEFYRPEERVRFKRLNIDKRGFTMVEDVCVKKEEREEHIPFF